MVIVAGEDIFNKKKESIQKFWQAIEKVTICKSNPEEGLQILLDNENADSALNKEVETESLEILLPLMEDENVPFGYQDEESWQEVADWLFEMGVIKTKVDPQEIVQNIVSK